MRDYTKKTHIGRVFRVLLSTIDAATLEWNGKWVWYEDFSRRDIVKLNARLYDLRRDDGPRFGFRVVDMEDYKDNCSGHHLEVVDRVRFTEFLNKVYRQDVERGFSESIFRIDTSLSQGSLL